jgi:hypothetical protein
MNKKQITGLIGGLGLGAGLGAAMMYFLDPDRGRRRRTMVRDKVNHNIHEANRAIRGTSNDLRHRVHGFFAEVKAAINGDEAGDDVVAVRVRAKMGHVIEHSGSIEVQVSDGHVTLSGPIVAEKVERLLAAVSGVRGVRGVENRLEVYERSGVIAGMKGESARPLLH